MKIWHWCLGASIALILVAGIFFDAQPAAVSRIVDPGTFQSKPRTTALAAPTDASTTQGFEYFPDRFQNQAKEPAEPIATF